jgi:predicted RNase H-like nuclease
MCEELRSLISENENILDMKFIDKKIKSMMEYLVPESDSLEESYEIVLNYYKKNKLSKEYKMNKQIEMLIKRVDSLERNKYDIIRRNKYFEELINTNNKLKILFDINIPKEMRMVKTNGLDLQYIINPSKELCLEAIKEDYGALQYIKDPELCLEIVKENSYALKYVNEEIQTNEFLIELYNLNKEIDFDYVKLPEEKWSIKFYLCTDYSECDDEKLVDKIMLKKQTKEIWDEIFKSEIYSFSEILKYMKDEFKTKELCLEVVKKRWYALQFVKEQTQEMCLEAVKQNVTALEYVKEQTSELCLEAVKKSWYALQFVKEQTSELCLEAVKENSNAVLFVEKKYETEELYNIYIKNNLKKIKKEELNKYICDNWEIKNYKEKDLLTKIIFVALNNGFYYSGRIIEINDSNYKIKYFDGDENLISKNVPMKVFNLNEKIKCYIKYRIEPNNFLKYVKEQTPEICLKAVKQNGNALEYVKEQTPELCLEAVKENGYSLQYVKEQTPEICLEAVKKNWSALQYVKEQTPEICLEAVKKNWSALQYVKEQTPEICLEAVKKNLSALQYVKEQTPEICLKAVKQNGKALKYVKEQTPEICLEAVKQNGHALLYVKEQTPELCLKAVKQNGYALLYVKEQTIEMCLEAVKQNIKFFAYFKNKDLDYLYKILELLINHKIIII